MIPKPLKTNQIRNDILDILMSDCDHDWDNLLELVALAKLCADAEGVNLAENPITLSEIFSKMSKIIGSEYCGG